jgi:4-hydroxy-3-polyprenylbenzoate decarboxylase
VRETPFSLIHLRNLTQLAEAGAVVMPASPGFYHRPKTVQDLLDHVVARALDRLGVDNELFRRWSGLGDQDGD